MKKTNAIRLLQQKKIAFDTVHYIYDSENLDVRKIAEDNKLELEHIYKTLVLEGDKTGIVVALVAGNEVVSLKKMAAVSKNKKVAMLAVKDLQKYTGYVRGGCSPIGMKKQYPIYISEAAKNLEKLYINAGTRGTLVGVAPSDLYALAQAEWAEIV